MNLGGGSGSRYFLTSLAVGLAGWASPTALAETKPHPKKIYQTDPVLREVMASVTFWVNFDESPEPIMGNANPDPARTAPQGCDLAPGLVGQAFLSRDGAACSYDEAGNLDFSKRGALSFWVCPVEWKPSDNEANNVFFSTPYSPKGYLGIERQGLVVEAGLLKRARALFLYILYFPGTRPNNNLLQVGEPENWKNDDWHLLVLNWKGARFELSLDGESPRSMDFGRPLENNEASRMLIGGCVEPTLVDEFMIYNRPLQEPEIAAIYRALGH